MPLTTKKLAPQKLMGLLSVTGKRKEICVCLQVKEGKFINVRVTNQVDLCNKSNQIMLTVSNHCIRTIAREHIPKKHLDFENPIITDKVFDNTANRVYGESKQEIMSTNNTEYGTGKNKADTLATMGRKTKNIEYEIAMKVAEEMREKARREDEERQRRFFETTSGVTYEKKDLTANVIGRKVMRTQDGNVLQGVAFDIL